MGVFFFDSSAIVKRYVSEPGSPRVVSLTDPGCGNRVYLARISSVEVLAAIARQARAGNIDMSDVADASRLFRHDLLHEYRIVEITSAVLDRAMDLVEAHPLRAYDAVQLASALDINRRRLTRGLPPIVLVSCDVALNDGAFREGLNVEDPTAHP
jgi:predicted nucleic acid-binding protein